MYTYTCMCIYIYIERERDAYKHIVCEAPLRHVHDGGPDLAHDAPGQLQA